MLTIVAALSMACGTGEIDYTQPHGDACLGAPIDGLRRCWDLELPADRESAAPLLIDLHGLGSGPREERSLTGFDELAREAGVIVVWPHGYERSWNAGGRPWRDADEVPDEAGFGCCGAALTRGVDDVGFLRAAIQEISARHSVDRERIYLTGFSNGCFMAQRLAAEAPELIAGVACLAGFAPTPLPEGKEPVSVLLLHGTADAIVPYPPSTRGVGAVANALAWARRNGCGDEPVETWREGPHFLLEAGDCPPGGRVALLTLDGGGHGSGIPLETPLNLLAWRFLSEAGERGPMGAGALP